VAAGCQESGGPPAHVDSPASSEPVASASSDVVILTASNDIERLDVASAALRWKTPLGGIRQDGFAAHVMAVAGSGNHVVVLVRGSPSVVVFVDLSTGRVTARRELPPGLVYRGVDVGPASGRVYLFANRDVGPDRGGELGPLSEAVVVVLDSDLSNVLISQTVRSTYGFNWRVYRGAVDRDETRILLSYHGPDSTGVDLIHLNGTHLDNRCATSSAACIPSHGGFAVGSRVMFFATGSSPILRTDHDGNLLGDIDTGIEGEHIMELTLDGSQRFLFIAGSCLYSDGLFEVDTVTRTTRIVDPPRSDTCGERVMALSDSVLVVIDPHVVAIDRKTGRINHSLKFPTDPAVDGLVVGR